MGEVTKTLAMRIEGSDAAVAAALAPLDPDARAERDPATGITRVTTIRQTLEVEDALVRAGLQVTAATG